MCRRDAGADLTIDASEENLGEKLRQINGGMGVDVVVDFVSSSTTLKEGFLGLNRGGRLLVLGGVPQNFILDSNALKFEREVMGSKYCTRVEVEEALKIVADGEIWPIVSEVVPLEEAEAPFSIGSGCSDWESSRFGISKCIFDSVA